MDYKDPAVIELRKKSYDFDRLCIEHQKIEAEIDEMSKGKGNSAEEELKINTLKKKKLVLKETIDKLLNAK